MEEGKTSRQYELQRLSEIPVPELVGKIESRGHIKGFSWLFDCMRTHAESKLVQAAALTTIRAMLHTNDGTQTCDACTDM